MRGVGLAVRQVRYTNKAFWRNPASAFFTFVFPLMFLVIFTALLGNDDTQLPAKDPGTFITTKLSTYYVASMATFGVIGACYTNIAISVSFQRDGGILKRTRGTPLPGWVYLTGRVIHAVIVAILLVLITMVFGALFYGARVPEGISWLNFLATLIVGGASFAALGLALTAAIPNADASPPIVNATILPLLFLSGIFIPLGKDPATWIDAIGILFPVRHFAEAMRAGYLGAGIAFDWTDVLVIAAWGVVGLLLASRFFSWEPRK